MESNNISLFLAILFICGYILMMIPVGVITGIVAGSTLIGKGINFIFKGDEKK